jgi:hypothetical protein
MTNALAWWRIGLAEGRSVAITKGIRKMQLSHTFASTSVQFDEPNLVSSAGLVPILALAESVGLLDLADEHLNVPGDKGANAGSKVASLVAGMVAGADSIDDMELRRHGGMGRVFTGAYASSTPGFVPACVQLWTRPAVGCGRLPVPARSGEWEPGDRRGRGVGDCRC